MSAANREMLKLSQVLTPSRALPRWSELLLAVLIYGAGVAILYGFYLVIAP